MLTERQAKVLRQLGVNTEKPEILLSNLLKSPSTFCRLFTEEKTMKLIAYYGAKVGIDKIEKVIS